MPMAVVVVVAVCDEEDMLGLPRLGSRASPRLTVTEEGRVGLWSALRLEGGVSGRYASECVRCGHKSKHAGSGAHNPNQGGAARSRDTLCYPCPAMAAMLSCPLQAQSRSPLCASTMSDSDTISGSCYCSATSFRISRPAENLTLSSYCHCSRCQRLNGAPFIWVSLHGLTFAFQ